MHRIQLRSKRYSTTGGLNNSYSYDTSGEQTGRTLAGTAYTLAYDYDGQMTSVTQGSVTTSFAYDAEGRRVGRTAGGYNSASTGRVAVSWVTKGFVSYRNVVHQLPHNTLRRPVISMELRD